MAHDGSMASLVEAWIVTQIEALAPFADRNVEAFAGSTEKMGEKLIAEMMAGKGSPFVVVMFEGDRPIPLEEGAQAYEPIYGIYVLVQNARPGVARMGETVGATTTYGTNGIRDLLRNALHDKSPDLGANGFYTDQTTFRGVRVVFQRTDMFVMRAELIVRETIAAA